MAAMASPTRLRVRTEVLAGTWEALVTGQADLAIGVTTQRDLSAGVTLKELGRLEFVFVVAPHHPLASASEPIGDAEIVRHRAVAVADSAHRLVPLTVNLLPGQDVLTVSDMGDKIEALARGVGCGFVPEPMAREAIAAGRLVVRQVERVRRTVPLGYAWRSPAGHGGKAQLGLALRWWLDRLESATTRRALLERHGGATSDAAAR
jgi:DNA-binding transcriptional LysR family regulator